MDHLQKWIRRTVPLLLAMAFSLSAIAGEHERRERREGGDHREQERDEHRERRDKGRGGDALTEMLREFPEARRDEVKEFMQRYFPHRLKEVQQLRRHEPEEAAEFFRDTLNETLELLELREEEAEEFERAIKELEVERKTEEMAQTFERATPEERKKLLAELKDMLDQAFEMRQKAMKTEVEHLEREMRRLKTMVEKREQNKALIIDRRIQQLTGEMDYLEW